MHTLSKRDYHDARDRLGARLFALQRQALALELPVIILIEGLSGSGRGDTIGRLVEHLDPRGFDVHSTLDPEAEHEIDGRPWLARFWERTPAAGRISIFDHTWYSHALHRRLDGGEDWHESLSEIVELEGKLVSGGALLIKLWLEVGEKTQRKRFKRWKHDAAQRWRVSSAYTERFGFERLAATAAEMRAATELAEAPWIELPADQTRERRIAALEAVVQGLSNRLETGSGTIGARDATGAQEEADGGAAHHPDTLPSDVELPHDSPLARVDLSLTLDRDEYDERLDVAQERLRELQFMAFRLGLGTVIMFEGWDAAGKGGAIRRMIRECDPRGYSVIPVAAPLAFEKRHHYLWRFWRMIPRAGEIAIFDRSWYGRVLVERVEGFAREMEWRRAYDEINGFEAQLCRTGFAVVKFWLHVSPEEQLRRFRDREATARKHYKLTDDDWRNRAKYGSYLTAVDDMLRRTHSAVAPWTIVEAEDKLFARVKVVETVAHAIETSLD